MFRDQGCRLEGRVARCVVGRSSDKARAPCLAWRARCFCLAQPDAWVVGYAGADEILPCTIEFCWQSSSNGNNEVEMSTSASDSRKFI